MWLLLLAACDPAAESPTLEVTVTPVEAVGTVAHVTWHSDSPGIGWVVYGRDGEEKLETHRDAEATTDHDILVAGLTPNAGWQLRAHEDRDGEELTSDPVTFATGPLPDTDISVGSVTGQMASARWVLQGTLGTGVGSAIFDDRGVPVWAAAYDYGRMSSRVRLTDDGTTLLISNFDVEAETPDYGEIDRMLLDGTVLDPIPAPGGHHDFCQIPEGYAYLAIDVRTVEDRAVVGDQILEVDATGAPLGRAWTTYSTWDPANAAPELDDFYPQGLDWTHANTLDYDAATDEYILSVRNLSAVLRISRATGAVVQQIGGPGSPYTLTSGKAFESQHSPQFITPTDLLVMDNTDTDVSAVREYSIDPDAQTYAETWHLESPSHGNMPVLGDVERSADGHTLVSWSLTGVLEERDAEGKQGFRLDLPLGSAFSFFQPLTQLGGPTPQ